MTAASRARDLITPARLARADAAHPPTMLLRWAGVLNGFFQLAAELHADGWEGDAVSEALREVGDVLDVTLEHGLNGESKKLVEQIERAERVLEGHRRALRPADVESHAA